MTEAVKNWMLSILSAALLLGVLEAAVPKGPVRGVVRLAAGLVLAVEGKWDRRLWKALALYWLFLLSWIPITFGSFVKKTTVWEEIRHTRATIPEALTR